jgi:hypothetical protein
LFIPVLERNLQLTGGKMLHPVQNKLLQNLYDDLLDLFADKDEETAQMGFAFQGVGIYEHSELNQIKITYAGVGYEYLSPKALAGPSLAASYEADCTRSQKTMASSSKT